MDMDIPQCVKRNLHKRSEEEINNIAKNWEKTSFSETILDVRSLLQSASITEVSCRLVCSYQNKLLMFLFNCISIM